MSEHMDTEQTVPMDGTFGGALRAAETVEAAREGYTASIEVHGTAWVLTDCTCRASRGQDCPVPFAHAPAGGAG